MNIETGKLLKKTQIKENIFLMEFTSHEIYKTAKPGQFVNILVNKFPLRRPFSIFEVLDQKIKIGIKVKGNGTKEMAMWPEGTITSILGPLGTGFLPPKPSDKILIIGGGIGCFALFEFAKNCKTCTTLLGFKTTNQIILKKEFEAFGPVLIYTENGSTSTNGLVTTNLEQLIKKEQINRIACCGPLPMMKAVFKIARNFDVFCEVCLEEHMACGIGACLGCQCKTKKNGKIKSKHVCCDGPVFNAKEVFFD